MTKKSKRPGSKVPGLAKDAGLRLKPVKGMAPHPPGLGKRVGRLIPKVKLD